MQFFKKKSTTKLVSQSYSLTDFGTTEANELPSDEPVKLALHFLKPPTSPEDTYYLQYLLNEVDPVLPNQVRIDPIALKKSATTVTVQFFIHNATSQSIFLTTVPVLFSTRDKVLAKKPLMMSSTNPIPAYSSVPMVVSFKEADLNEDMATISEDMEWNLQFELKKPHRLELNEEWKKFLTVEDQKSLADYVKKLPLPSKNEISTQGFQIQYTESGDLSVFVLFRSGYEKAIEIKQMPLKVVAGDGQLIAQANFETSGMQLNPQTSKPWAFIFPKESLETSLTQFDEWRVEIQSPSK